MHTPVLFDDAEDIPETFGFVHITRKPDVLHLRIQIKHLQVVPTGKGGKKVFQPHIAENNPPVFPGGMQISVDLPLTVCLLQTPLFAGCQAHTLSADLFGHLHGPGNQCRDNILFRISPQVETRAQHRDFGRTGNNGERV